MITDFTDTITLHIATADTITAPYAEAPISSISALAGYTSTWFRAEGGGEGEEAEGDEVEYIDKEVRGSLYMRDIFEIHLIPFSVKASAWDLSDWAAIKPYIAKAKRYQHSWLELTAIADAIDISQPYHTVANAIPVQLTDVGSEMSGGYVKKTLTFRRKFVTPLS